MDKILILNKIRQYYKLNKDSDFARFLGVNSQNIRNWYKRNNYNANLLIDKCKEISPTFIVTGEGNLLRSECDEMITTEEHSKETIELPASVWKIIQAQAESLVVRDKQLDARDRQIDELIKLLKSQMEENRKNDVRTDNATCADAG